MEPPPGLDITEGCVCRLIKSLFGLKQSARQWSKRLSIALISLGFKIEMADPGLLIKEKTSAALIIYVDDIIGSATSENELKQIEENLKVIFELKSLGIPKYLLSMQLEWFERGVPISQSFYIKKIVKKYIGLDANTVKYP